ncbi:hypothetical protein FOZ62_019219, partial [Perkinsus olseni]
MFSRTGDRPSLLCTTPLTKEEVMRLPRPSLGRPQPSVPQRSLLKRALAVLEPERRDLRRRLEEVSPPTKPSPCAPSTSSTTPTGTPTASPDTVRLRIGTPEVNLHSSAASTRKSSLRKSPEVKPDEHDLVEIINENGTDPISVRNLEPGESCNDDCLHAKFEALERMQLRLNSSLEPVEDVIEGRGGSDPGLIGRVNEVKPAGVSIGKLLDTTMSKLFSNLQDLQKNGAREIRVSKEKYKVQIGSVQDSVNAMLKRIGNSMVVNSYALEDSMGKRLHAATSGVAATQRSSVRDANGVDRKISKAGGMVDKNTAQFTAGLDDAADDIKKLLSKGRVSIRKFNTDLLKDLDRMTSRERTLLGQRVKAAKHAEELRVEQAARQMQGRLSQSSQFFNSLTADAQRNFTAEIATAGIGLEGVNKLTDKALSDLFERMEHGVGRLSREDARAVLAQHKISVELQKDIALQEELTKRMSSSDADALSKIREALGQDSATAEKVLMLMAKSLEGETRHEANSIEADLAAVALKSRQGALAFEQALGGDTAKLQHFIRELELKLGPQMYGAGKALRDSEGVVEGNLRDMVFRKEDSLKGMSRGITGRISGIGREAAKSKRARIERGKETLKGIMEELSVEKSSDLHELLGDLQRDEQAHNELLALVGGSSVDSLKAIRHLATAIRGTGTALGSGTAGMDRLKNGLMKLAGRGDRELGALSTLLTQMAARNEAALKTQWAQSTMEFDDSRRDVGALLHRLVKEAKGNTTAKIPELLRAFVKEVQGIEASTADIRAIVAASDDDVRRLGAKLRANRAGIEISRNELKQTMGSLLQHVDASDSKYLIELADQSAKWSRYSSDQMKHYLDTETKALLDHADMEGVSADRIYTALSNIQHKLSTGDAVLDARLMAEESELSKESKAHKKKMMALGKHFI